MLFKTISEEAKLVTEEMIAAWFETTLPTILSQYLLQDIFNEDEFGLFIHVFLTRRIILRAKGAQEASIARFA